MAIFDFEMAKPLSHIKGYNSYWQIYSQLLPNLKPGLIRIFHFMYKSSTSEIGTTKTKLYTFLFSLLLIKPGESLCVCV